LKAGMTGNRQDMARSLEPLERAVRLEPASARAHWRLGNALAALERWDQALASYAAAVARDPEFIEAHLNLGNVLQTLERWDEALDCYDRALALRPLDAAALSNRGVVLKELHRFDAALEAFDRAIAANPGDATVRYNRGVLALLLGRYAEGWADYEWRWEDARGALFRERRSFPQPRWTGGDPLHGRTLLLQGEQGFGDVLQFCRYAAVIAAQGAAVVLEVRAPLLTLLADLDGIAQIVAAGRTLPAFDLHCPLLSVPFALQTTLETIPARIPYLYADRDKVARWRATLEAIPRPWVGLAWAGNPAYGNDRHRSIPLATLLSGLPAEFHYVSLQKDVPATDRAALAAATRLHSLDGEWYDFSDAAALIDALDLVISVDTSIVHLAGGLGKPGWVMLPYQPDWRWLLGRGDSPWYPSLVLYRQERRGDWAPVLARVAADLQQRFAGSAVAGAHVITSPSDPWVPARSGSP
jgi:tetratricopeptide (TPR) repeat protein